jgi:hypothetical protein
MLLAILASGTPQASETGHPPSAWQRTGPIEREIADSSPVAREVIEQPNRSTALLSPLQKLISKIHPQKHQQNRMSSPKTP